MAEWVPNGGICFPQFSRQEGTDGANLWTRCNGLHCWLGLTHPPQLDLGSRIYGGSSGEQRISSEQVSTFLLRYVVDAVPIVVTPAQMWPFPHETFFKP
jgi:hypothetical protein